jgi:hypothetical protein
MLFKKLEDKLLRKLIHRKLSQYPHWPQQREIMKIALEYDTERFPKDTIQIHLGSWRDATKAAINDIIPEK